LEIALQKKEKKKKTELAVQECCFSFDRPRMESNRNKESFFMQVKDD